MMILSKEKASPFKYDPKLDNANHEVFFKEKVERAKKFLIGKGMLVVSQDNLSTKRASE
jgi:hypothetical protein